MIGYIIGILANIIYINNCATSPSELDSEQSIEDDYIEYSVNKHLLGLDALQFTKTTSHITLYYESYIKHTTHMTLNHFYIYMESHK